MGEIYKVISNQLDIEISTVTDKAEIPENAAVLHLPNGCVLYLDISYIAQQTYIFSELNKLAGK